MTRRSMTTTRLYGIAAGLASVTLLGAGGAGSARAECSVPSLDNTVTMSAEGDFIIPSEQWGAAGSVTGEFAFTGSARACESTWVRFLEFGDWLDPSTWDNKGRSEPCNSDKMYGRLLTSVYLLGFSQTDGVGDGSLDWGMQYILDQLSDTTGECAWKDYLAWTQWAPVFGDEWTHIPKDFAYHTTPVIRAAVLMHEARHTENYKHDGNDGSPRCLAGGPSCDEYFMASQAIGGAPAANTYEAVFLADYAFRGVLRSVTSPVTFSTAPLTQRRSAQRWGNYVLAERIDQQSSVGVRISGVRVNTGGPEMCTYPPGPPYYNSCPTVTL